uniref:Ovule protein n=1 Tax=Caenorhabditis tropicalis TaxID=1561998 RepID=A0A1I7UQ86_9PELO
MDLKPLLPKLNQFVETCKHNFNHLFSYHFCPHHLQNASTSTIRLIAFDTSQVLKREMSPCIIYSITLSNRLFIQGRTPYPLSFSLPLSLISSFAF